MKSKHIAAYGEEIAHSNFRNYQIFDNFLYNQRYGNNDIGFDFGKCVKNDFRTGYTG